MYTSLLPGPNSSCATVVYDFFADYAMVEKAQLAFALVVCSHLVT